MNDDLLKDKKISLNNELILDLIKKVEIKSDIKDQIKELQNLENALTENQINNQQTIEYIVNNIKIGSILENILLFFNADEITDAFIRQLILKYKSQISEKDRELNYMLCDKSKESQTIIIEKFLPLVKKIANKYSGYGVDFEDLVSVGNLGLLKAIKLFDPNKNSKFITYAYFWIRSYISRENRNNSRTVRIPSHKYDELSAIKSYKNNFEKENHRLPTSEEIMNYFGYTRVELQELNNLMMNADSLDRKMNDDEDSRELGTVIADNKISIEEQCDKEMLFDELLQLFEKAHLTDKEIFVLTKRYGLQNQKSMTLDDIAKLCNLSRQRISQIEQRAMVKLKRSPFTKNLKVYLDDFVEHEEKSESKIHTRTNKDISTKQNGSVSLSQEGSAKKMSEKEEQNETGSSTIRGKSIFEKFPLYTKEEVVLAISKLPEEFKEIVYKKYGRDLGSYYIKVLNAKENNLFYGQIKQTILKYLENPNYEYKSKKLNLFQRLSEYDEETIHQAILELPEEYKQILHSKYGNNFDECFIVDRNISNKLNQLVLPMLKNRCKKILQGPKSDDQQTNHGEANLKSIYKMFPLYTKEELVLAISKLPEEFKEIVYKKYGNNLENDNTVVLTKREKNLFFCQIKPTILKYLENPNYEYKSKKLNLFQRLSEYDKTIIQQAVLELPEEYQQILYSKYGNNFDECFIVDRYISNKLNQLVLPMLKNRCKIILQGLKPDDQNTYDDIDKLVSSPEFIDFAIKLDLEDITHASIAIAFSYVNGMFTSLDEISKILSIDRSVIKETMKKVLLAYKKYLNEEIDRTIEKPFQKHLS